ncbi:hypothetical protein RvY_12812 [Ramazzottius varieornatus]|uniref:Uncharacterized protein n=1 Tax=Ramazzottius varieornatus TaxID=947166 RepID=A0A1D1VR68_RAMVA|nr:hypothetical protein RvY_12812 [Ramazzottius varieornatus]
MSINSKRGNSDTLTITRDALDDIMRTMRELKVSLDRKVAEKHRTDELHRRQILDLSCQLGLDKKASPRGDVTEQTRSLKEQIGLKDEVHQLRRENQQLKRERQEASSQDRLTSLLKCQIDQLRRTNSEQQKQIEKANEKSKEEARLHRLRVASLEGANSSLFRENQASHQRLREQTEPTQNSPRSSAPPDPLPTPLCTSTPKRYQHAHTSLLGHRNENESFKNIQRSQTGNRHRNDNESFEQNNRYHNVVRQRNDNEVSEVRPYSVQTCGRPSPWASPPQRFQTQDTVPLSATDLGEDLYQNNNSFSAPQPVYTQCRKVDVCHQSGGPTICSKETQMVPQSVTDMGGALHNIVSGPHNELPDVRRCLPEEPRQAESVNERASQQFITSCRQPPAKPSLNQNSMECVEAPVAEPQCNMQGADGEARKSVQQSGSLEQISNESNKLSKQVKSLKKSLTKLQENLSADDRFKRENEELRAQVSHLNALIDRQALVLRRDRHEFFDEEDSTLSLPRPFGSEEFQGPCEKTCERTCPEPVNSFAEHHDSYGDPEVSSCTQPQTAICNVPVSSCNSAKDSWFDFLDRKEQELLSGRAQKKSWKCADPVQPACPPPEPPRREEPTADNAGCAVPLPRKSSRSTLPLQPVSYIPPRRTQ